jgi:hypothetical protein
MKITVIGTGYLGLVSEPRRMWQCFLVTHSLFVWAAAQQLIWRAKVGHK